jgi:hypothetical protein
MKFKFHVGDLVGIDENLFEAVLPAPGIVNGIITKAIRIAINHPGGNFLYHILIGGTTYTLYERWIRKI